MSLPVVLFVSHCEKQCGVHQFGRNIANVLASSQKYRFVYVECSDAETFRREAERACPAAVIFNHYHSTLPWLAPRLTHQSRIPQIGILHEVTQDLADRANNLLFDYHIAPDPSLVINNPIVFKTGRLIPHYSDENQPPPIPTIGCFGFGT